MDLKILNIAADTDNNRNIKNRTHISKLKNSLCGDEMQIELVIKNKKRTAASTRAEGAGKRDKQRKAANTRAGGAGVLR